MTEASKNSMLCAFEAGVSMLNIITVPVLYHEQTPML